MIAGGDALLAPRITKRLIERFARTLPADPPPPPEFTTTLTDRELEVLIAVAGGRSNREICDDLHMGYGTVKTHVSHLLTKLACRDRAQLVMFAYENRITVPATRGPGA